MNQQEELPPIDAHPAAEQHPPDGARARDVYTSAVAVRLGTTGEALRPWCEKAWRIAHYAVGFAGADIPAFPWAPEPALVVRTTVDEQGRRTYHPANSSEAQSLLRGVSSVGPNPLSVGLANTKARLEQHRG